MVYIFRSYIFLIRILAFGLSVFFTLLWTFNSKEAFSQRFSEFDQEDNWVGLLAFIIGMVLVAILLFYIMENYIFVKSDVRV